MNYKDSRWIKKRVRILKRDSYECRECRRYGKATLATTVHHIKPVEQHPRLWLSNQNLYSCCSRCHNTFHDRITNELTNRGLELVDRIYKHTPPPN